MKIRADWGFWSLINKSYIDWLKRNVSQWTDVLSSLLRLHEFAVKTNPANIPSATNHCHQSCPYLHHRCWASWAWCTCAHRLTHSTQATSSSSAVASASSSSLATLQTSSPCYIKVSSYNRSTYGRRAFSVVGPMTWNSLTDSLRDPLLSIDSFRHQLKTFLFSN